MINQNSISYSLYTTLSSNSTLVNSNVTVELNEVFNTDPNRVPWVGVYWGGTEIEPRRVGGGNPWQAQVEMRIFTQDISGQNGELTADNIDRLVFPVLAAVNSNKTLDGTVLHITEVSLAPFDRDIEDEDWMWSNEIAITAELEV